MHDPRKGCGYGQRAIINADPREITVDVQKKEGKKSFFSFFFTSSTSQILAFIPCAALCCCVALAAFAVVRPAPVVGVHAVVIVDDRAAHVNALTEDLPKSWWPVSVTPHLMPQYRKLCFLFGRDQLLPGTFLSSLSHNHTRMDATESAG